MTSRIPAYDAEFFTSAHLDQIIGLKANALNTWVGRYEGWLHMMGINRSVSGSPRRFTIGQIGLLAVIRAANTVSLAHAALEALDLIMPHAADLYRSKVKGTDHGYGIEMPTEDEIKILIARPFFNSTPMFTPHAKPVLRSLYDDKGFAVPMVIVEMDSILINAWQRALDIFTSHFEVRD